MLTSLDEIDLSKIFGISFAVKSNVEQENMGFYIELLKWNEREISFKLAFDKPEYVSKGEI